MSHDNRANYARRQAIFHSFMHKALELAKKAYEQDEVPVGAVIVDPESQEIISAIYNRMEIQGDPTAHAEMLAIREACTKLGKSRLDGYDLYVTLEPCPMCAQAISFARIRRLYFAAYDPKGGGVEHGARVYNAASCHHKPEVYGGIEETAAQDLLRRFFKEKR